MGLQKGILGYEQEHTKASYRFVDSGFLPAYQGDSTVLPRIGRDLSTG